MSRGSRRSKRWGAGIGAVAAVLTVTAAVAAAGQAKAHYPDTYSYSKTRGTYLSTTVYGGKAWSVYQPQVVEQWIAEDGSGRQRTASAIPWFVTPADRQIWEEAGKPRFLAYGFREHVGDELLPKGSFRQYPQWARLLSQMPLDPAQLSIWLTRRVNDPATGPDAGNGFEESVKTLKFVTELMQSPDATAAQRAALFAAELRVPGVEQLGAQRDSVGREGIAIGARSSNSGAPTLYSQVFDPDAARLLESKAEWQAPPAGLQGLEGPLVESSTAYTSEGTTLSARARPGKRGGPKHSPRR